MLVAVAVKKIAINASTAPIRQEKRIDVSVPRTLPMKADTQTQSFNECYVTVFECSFHLASGLLVPHTTLARTCLDRGRHMPMNM